MPQDKDIKRLVRARMAETGERYTQAKSAVDTRDRADEEPEAVYRLWVDALGDSKTAHAAYARLKALPAETLRPLAVAGTTHDNWRIRKGCCRLLDDIAFTPESLAALERCLDDVEPRVRMAAMHSLSCQHCKPDGCTVDSQQVFERMALDPNARVRKRVVTGMWSQEAPWREALLRRLATEDRSAQVRAIAATDLEGIERMRRSDSERRLLPADLVAKTERHRGKWVAISAGRIVGVGLSRKACRRYDDLRIYWVAPEA